MSGTAQARAVPARITQAVDDGNRVTLQGNVHPLARFENDRGLAPDSQPIRRILLLLQRAPEQELALRKLLDEQQTKSSPNYHQWLTPEQLGEQFGPADSDIQAVNDWLTRQGFQVNRVAAGRTVIEFSGTAGMVRQSLHTEIHKFAANGEEHWANASDPQIPVALAPVVAGIASLNNFPRKSFIQRLGTFSRSKITGEVKPLFTFGSAPNYGIGPGDFATIYNVRPLWNANPAIDGTGQTIAIVGDSNINIQDVRDFRQMFGLPAKDPVIILDGPDPGIIPNTEGEADLDVEWAGAVAKGATIDLVVSEDTESTLGTDLSALYIVDKNLASVLSVSFGACEAALGIGGNAFENAVWEQAAAQGITVVVASGDSGSATCDAFNNETAATFGLAVSGVASTPFNVALGGTDFDFANNQSQYFSATNTSPLQNSALSYIPEKTWNQSCAQNGLTGCASPTNTALNLVGGGGGQSNCIAPSSTLTSFTCGTVNALPGYPKPAWQTGTGVPPDNVRDIPDVSIFAAAENGGSFYIMCESDANTGSTSSCNLLAPYQQFEAVGGTSVSAPTFAGIMALVNQKTGRRQGNANYVLYKLAAQPGLSCDSSNPTTIGSATCVFNDVTRGNNSVACVGGSLNCSNTSAAANQFGVLVNPANTSQLAWTTNAGFDLATGLGTVNAANMVSKWSSVSFSGTTTTLANLSPTTITHGQPVNVTINVTSGSGTPTGAVSLVGSQPSGIAAFSLTNGSFSGTTIFLPGGTYNVTAHYAGDGTFGASDSTPPIQVTVNKEASQTQVGVVTFDINTGQITSINATSFPYGSPYIVRANVLNSAGNACSPQASPGSPNLFPVSGCPTGTVTITANGNPLPNQNPPATSNFPLNSQGYTEDVPVQFPGGSYNMLASYPGDASFNLSASPTVALSVTKAATTLATAFAGTPVEYGKSEEVVAGVSTNSLGIAPTGTFTFLVDGAQVGGPVPVYESGTYNPNTSPPLFAWADAASTITFPSVGNHTLSAQYSGDAYYQPATSPPTAVPVTKALPSFAGFGTIPWPPVVGQQETLTAQMYPYGTGATPTGTMTFSDGSTALSGTVTYTPIQNGGLAASLPYIFTTSGTHNMTVTYSGDSNYLTTSASFSITATAPDFSLPVSSPAIAISAPGQSGSSTITVSALSGFTATGTVNLTCAIPATMAEATCALSPASLTTSSTATLTVTTTASHTVGSVFNVLDLWFGGGKGISLLCTLVLALGLMGRKRRLAFGLLLFAVIAAGYSGCGGGSSYTTPPPPVTDPGTVPGAYTVTVTANNGTFSHTSSVAVNLQ